MSHYILVHGAWEESGMWDNVSPILRDDGHRVTAIDLPGHGVNRDSDGEVTRQRYIEALIDVINSSAQPVILVGHSMNGALISQVAEEIPEKIQRLVYVTAFLLKNGGSVLEAMQSDTGGEALPEIVFSEDEKFATLPEPALLRVGFHDVNEAEIQRILPMMAEWQATEPFMAQVALSHENFGSVPKTYIRTNNDKMISPASQERMIANWDVDSVFTLKSGHFPTSAVPNELAEQLLQIASLDSRKVASNG